MVENKFRDLSDREIKVRQLQIDIHEDSKREKQVEIDRLQKEIADDIPNKKVRIEIRKLTSDIELFNEVISKFKKEIREKKTEVVEKKV